MNILGVGAWELVAILLIMLVFAGPKRMIHWSYVLGQHVAKFRKIWSETVDLVQKEFDDAGLDIKLPKEPPTRKNLNRTISDAVKPVTNPLQESIKEVQQDLDSVEEVSDALNNKKPKLPAKSTPAKAVAESLGKSAKAKAKRPSTKRAIKPAPVLERVDLGTWNGGPADAANGMTPDLGAWSRSSVNRQGRA